MEFDNCGQRFKESIATLIKAVAKKEERKRVEEIFNQFWKILSIVLSMSFLNSGQDYIIRYYNTKVNELLEAASELNQSLKFPPLTQRNSSVSGQEESVALTFIKIGITGIICRKKIRS